MQIQFLSILLLFFVNFYFAQSEFDKIEFEYGNSIIIGSYIKIKLQPIKNNKKGKVKVTFESKDNFYTKRISKEKYIEICNSIYKIKNDTIIKTTCIDGSNSFIKTFQSSLEKVYYLDCVSLKDEFDENRKNFWLATKLIVGSAKIKIKNLKAF